MSLKLSVNMQWHLVSALVLVCVDKYARTNIEICVYKDPKQKECIADFPYSWQ